MIRHAQIGCPWSERRVARRAWYVLADKACLCVSVQVEMVAHKKYRYLVYQKKWERK